MALTGKVAVDFDYYKDILGRVRDKAKDVGFRKAYDDMLDALVTVHEEGYKDPETGDILTYLNKLSSYVTKTYRVLKY